MAWVQRLWNVLRPGRLQDDIAREVRGSLWLLFGAVTLLLLIAHEYCRAAAGARHTARV